MMLPALAVLLGTAVVAAEAPKPNIVVLLCDDLARARQFYLDVMKFRLERETPRWVSFHVGSGLLCLAIGLSLSATALARPADDATDLDQISVTATRTEVAVQDSLVPVQVISREEIERSQATSLPELLQVAIRTVPALPKPTVNISTPATLRRKPASATTKSKKLLV